MSYFRHSIRHSGITKRLLIHPAKINFIAGRQSSLPLDNCTPTTALAMDPLGGAHGQSALFNINGKSAHQLVCQ